MLKCWVKLFFAHKPSEKSRKKPFIKVKQQENLISNTNLWENFSGKINKYYLKSPLIAYVLFA